MQRQRIDLSKKERNLMMQKSAIVASVSLCEPQATLYYPRFFVQLLLLENNAVARIPLIFIPFIISLCSCTIHIFSVWHAVNFLQRRYLLILIKVTAVLLWTRVPSQHAMDVINEYYFTQLALVLFIISFFLSFISCSLTSNTAYVEIWMWDVQL